MGQLNLTYLGRGYEAVGDVPRRRLWEAVVEPGGVPPDGRVEAVLVARRQEPAEGGERGALQRPGVVVAGAVEGPVGGEINRT